MVKLSNRNIVRLYEYLLEWNPSKSKEISVKQIS